MVIALDEVAEEPLLSRALILVFVAFAITIGVYGVVGLIVKMDDIGLKLVESGKGASARSGAAWCGAMPILLAVLAKVGIIAMLWVGGHILLVGLDELGVHFLYDFVHHLEEDVHEAPGARRRRPRVAHEHRRLGDPRHHRRRDRGDGPAPAKGQGRALSA